MTYDLDSLIIAATFDDEGSSTLPCPPTGRFVPAAPLTAFDGKDAAGTWSLHATDKFLEFDAGTVEAWGIVLTCEVPSPGYVPLDIILD